MATLRAQAGPVTPGEPEYRLLRLGADRQAEGVAKLIGARGAGDEAVASFIRHAGEEGTRLDFMWASEPRGGGALRHVVLAVPNPGRTVGLFLSGATPRSMAQRTERAVVVKLAATELERSAELGDHLPQALLEADQVEPFVMAGFSRLADLAYMRRVVTHGGVHGAVSWPAGIRVGTVAEAGVEGERGLREALEASYIDTLDCPALCGLRSLDDVIVSHRSVGRYDASWWWLVWSGSRAVGCMLINPGVSHDTAELVYLGLAPEARGRGLARGLLAVGLERLARSRESVLACAVDLQNGPALRLYEGMKFTRFAVRVAVVRMPAGRG